MADRDQKFYLTKEYEEVCSDNSNTSNKGTNNSTQETKKEKKVKKARKEKKINLSTKLNKNQIERDDNLNLEQGKIDTDMIPGNDGNNEEAVNDCDFDNINNITKNDNNAINNTKEKSKTFVTSKKRGPAKKNHKKQYIHGSDEYSNVMVKSARAFVKFFMDFFNLRCESCGLDKLTEIKVLKAYGFGYKRHRRFLKRRMQIVFGYRNKHNKKVIKKMMVKDEIFAGFMKMKVKKAFIHYEKKYPYLHLENSRIFSRMLLSQFKTVAEDRNILCREEFEKIKKSNFEKAIDEERGRRRSPQKKIKKSIYCIRY